MAERWSRLSSRSMNRPPGAGGLTSRSQAKRFARLITGGRSSRRDWPRDQLAVTSHRCQTRSSAAIARSKFSLSSA